MFMHLSVCQSVFMSLYLRTFIHFSAYIYLSVSHGHLSVCLLSVFMSLYLRVFINFSAYVYLSVSHTHLTDCLLSACLYLHKIHLNKDCLTLPILVHVKKKKKKKSLKKKNLPI